VVLSGTRDVDEHVGKETDGIRIPLHHHIRKSQIIVRGDIACGDASMQCLHLIKIITYTHMTLISCLFRIQINVFDGFQCGIEIAANAMNAKQSN
jgi:hypothetical protein